MSIFAERFDGRTAVIIGGAPGLGREVGRRIVQECGMVSLWDLNPAALQRHVTKSVRRTSRSSMSVTRPPSRVPRRNQTRRSGALTY
jgi:NAD(P)-dependent dehydrogenase (short-subunit alcohol dehydrogenase family)